MKLYNIKHPEERVSFSQAVVQGLGKDQGLFFPEKIPTFSPAEVQQLLELPFVARSTAILAAFIGDEFSPAQIQEFVSNAFNFAVPVSKVDDDIHCLELWHGPTLAFKDFGGRFMAQVLGALAAKQGKITILTATSGDTGAAVAHAFYNVPNIEVVVLYPEGRISELQEKLFCTLGGNIKTIAIKGDFDACQALVKRAFDDQEVKARVGLNSANSINISRLLAQISYYWEAVAQLQAQGAKEVVVSVPSGNFGNLTAGLIAKAMGLPVKRFIASTNANDTVPRYLATGTWDPAKTKATLSNAMDVSKPNNWPRIEELFKVQGWALTDLASGSVSDATTAQTIKTLKEQGFLSEPHGAVGYRVLRDNLQAGETGVFLGTAHPAKFKQEVENIVGYDIGLPAELAAWADKELLSEHFADDYEQLKKFLLEQTAAGQASK